ncbi:MAG: hypothetical protein ABFS32_21570, partial [Bacteroidota bacterium]
MKKQKRLLLTIILMVGITPFYQCSEPTEKSTEKPVEQIATQSQKSEIIKTYDKGFYEIKENGLKVLHLAGTGYERGYQYGIMLKDEIEESI